MTNVIKAKNLSGKTGDKCIEFGYTKRCNDKVLRTFNIRGCKNPFNEEIMFFSSVEKFGLENMLNIVGIIVEIYLLIHYIKFIIIAYTLVIVINLIALVMFINDYSSKQLHGAEHMMINSYTNYNKITDLDNIKRQSIISHRCGTIHTMTQVIVYIFVVVTKIPIPLGIASYLLFKIKPIAKVLSLFEHIVVEKPNEEQLLLAKATFDLLIEVMEKGLEDKEEINSYIDNYVKIYNKKEIFEET